MLTFSEVIIHLIEQPRYDSLVLIGCSDIKASMQNIFASGNGSSQCQIISVLLMKISIMLYK